MWGVTLDDIERPKTIVEALTGLSARPTARIVFDPGMDPDYYRDAVQRIRKVADVMGEPVDSYEAKVLTVMQYRQRMVEFMNAFGSSIALYEVGNEANGEWTGKSETMAEKIRVATKEAKTRKLKTVLTLYYQVDDPDPRREMIAWSQKYLTEQDRRSFDYVLVSYYATSANGAHPDWKRQFASLAKLFPTAKLGFGELGLQKPDGTPTGDAKAKEALIRRYYTMKPPIADRFVGGYFWWTFRQDAVPKTKGLWKVFKDVIR